jgi:hypothetical protein
VHHTGEVERIPVGQADATVRLGLAYLVGLRCAVDAVRRCGEIDPDQADWIVRTGLMVSGSLDFTPFQANFGL